MSRECEICSVKGKSLVEVPLIRVPEGCMQRWLEESEEKRKLGFERVRYTTITCGAIECKETAARVGVAGRSYPEWRKK